MRIQINYKLPGGSYSDVQLGSQDSAPRDAAESAARRANVLFTVTSALSAQRGHSRFPDRERLEQTRATIGSIRARLPQSDIVVADASLERPDDSTISRLGSDIQFMWYGDMPHLQQLAGMQDFWFVKNFAELALYSRLLSELVHANSLERYQRIFKISGRYKLTERFDPVVHLSAEAADRFIFLRRIPTGRPIEQAYTNYQWRTRLFSYDPKLAYLLISLYSVALRDMTQRISRRLITDVEHSIARYLNPNLVLEVDVIGVAGEVGTYAIRIDE